MKRINFELRRCRSCKQFMARKRCPGGRLEPPTRYAARVFCGNACKARGYTKHDQYSACLQCTSVLKRKRYPSGIEQRRAYTRRRWCDTRCMILWLDDPLNRAEYKRWIDRGVEIRSRAPVCYHGVLGGVGCDWCSCIRRDSGARHRDVVKTPSDWRAVAPNWNDVRAQAQESR